MSFVHLHVLSEYSLLDSTLRLAGLPGLAVACGMPALALTDKMSLAGAVSFYDGCMAAGVLPILGIEAQLEPLAPDFWAAQSLEQAPPKTFQAVLLAKNNEGYKTLCSFISRAFESNDGVISANWLKEAGGNLVLLTGGKDGEIFKLLEKERSLEAAAVAEKFVKAFGEENVFLEIQWHGLECERKVMPEVKKLAASLKLPLVATNSCRYMKRSDAPIVELLRDDAKGKTVASLDELKPESDCYYFRHEDEMRKICRNIPEACDNTVKIAEMCHVELNPERKMELPRFPLEAGKSSMEALEELARAGIIKRYGENPDEKVKGRLDYELEIIDHLGFADYFLIVADYVNFAKSENIPVGPGRGSAVGSLVAYATGITEIDPLKYGLYFERFLNPSRRKMPDIDMDFCERRRGEVINYIRKRYGENHVAQVATFSTLRAKAALKDCAKVLGFESIDVEKVASLVDRYARDHNLKYRVITEAMNGSEGLHRYQRDVPEARVQSLLYAASQIEDLPRNVSLHAAAVVISQDDLRTKVPLIGSGLETRTQCGMYSVERMGLLKMDVLGLRTLTIMEDMKRIGRGAFSYESIPEEDEATLALISSGNTFGLFQLESEGMKRVLRQLKPRSFSDIIAVLALYRPGPMQYIDTFIARHNGEEEITYAHKKLEKVLSETYGIMLYQEQVMQALHLILGYSLGEADIFRQIMSKKKMAAMEKERDKFMEMAAKKRLKPETAEKLYRDIASFAGYGFNKSHATAYALISYRMAYVKAHFPAVYCAGLLNAHLGDGNYSINLLHEINSLNFELRAPDVNSSGALCDASLGENGKWNLHFGLASVKGVSERLAEAIVVEREVMGPFTSLDNFCLRLDKKLLQLGAVQNLIKAGAFDFTGKKRAALFLVAADLLDAKGTESALQRSFFSVEEKPSAELAWSSRDLARYEQEVLGVYVSNHPLLPWLNLWKEKVTLRAKDLPTAYSKDAKIFIMGGLVTGMRHRTSRQGGTYDVIVMEDFSGTFEVMLWDEYCRKFDAKIKPGYVWFVKGQIHEGHGEHNCSLWALDCKRFTPDGRAITEET